MKRFFLAALLFCSLLPTAPPQAAAQVRTQPSSDATPWAALEKVRRKLARTGATTARFEQTFVAAGFSSGDSENGHLAFSLPDCLRWDYSEPYPKSFLVCQDTVWYWNESDATGRRQEIESRNEPGLDLLLLSVDSLSDRYVATAEAGEGSTLRLVLEPKGEADEIATAWLTLDPEAGRVLRLEYHDREGNRTTFVIHDYAPLDSAEKFSPPAEIVWADS